MFGSLFRSAVVIGTIYAISPVKLDATPLPPASQAKAMTDLSAQAAAVAPRLVAAATSSATAQGSGDQIGDLIALGKDVCLANPGLCIEAAKALQDKALPEKPAAATPRTASVSPAAVKAQPVPAPVRQAETTKSRQPDALAALIEKTVPQPPHALAKSTR